MKARFFILSIVLAAAIQVNAQDSGVLLQDATEAYEMGNFELMETVLADKVDYFDDEDQLQAYRLLALSCLFRDMPDEAGRYAEKILSLDPFYSAYGDSPRFAALLSKLKKGRSTVTTASKMAESVEEVPVPVTLITQEMIKASGAAKLQDILMLYVPGLSEISSLEDNVAMRGVYGLGQETMLVLLDGHRLNSQSSNSESFDFRNSVDKIKQIEVLRGPASSLYGNVALTAVVNIITKSGSDVDGMHVSALTGSNGAAGGTMYLGNGNLQSDYLVWASIFKSDGTTVTDGETPHYVGAYSTKPSYDLGAKIRWGDFKVEASAQHGHPVPYHNLLSLTDEFTYDKYGKVNGEGPGLSRSMFRGDLEWSHTWRNFTLQASGFGASERMQIYNTLGDDVPYVIMQFLAKALNITSVKTEGSRQIISWDDYSFGGSVSGAYNYSLPGGMNGSAMIGFQSEDLIVGDATLMIGADFDKTNNVKHSILLDGIERTMSGFLQVKHYFTKRLIFNGGLRYDVKHRLDGRYLHTTSPRVSVIWQPGNVLTLKGGYSHAFVDAAAFYRGSTISLFSGGTSLNPEMMDSYQAGALFNWKDLGLKYELNTFYNNVVDMVYFNTYDFNSIAAAGNTFSNAGQIKMGGVENTIQLDRDRLMVNVNATYQYPFLIENFSSTDDYLNNVPRLLGNATAQYAVLAPKNGDRLWIRGHAHGQSEFKAVTNDLLLLFIIGQGDSYIQKGYVTYGAGLEWQSHNGLDLSFDASNLGDQQYLIGGQLLRGVPGTGRQFVFRMSYDF